jgi:hypothetical protein
MQFPRLAAGARSKKRKTQVASLGSGVWLGLAWPEVKDGQRKVSRLRKGKATSQRAEFRRLLFSLFEPAQGRIKSGSGPRLRPNPK